MTVVLPHVFATLPATPPTPASFLDDDFNVLANAINGLPATGIITNAQMGTTYTVQSTDLSKLVTFTNGSSIAVTLPQAVGAFNTPWFAYFYCLSTSTGTVTITTTISTINGASTLVLSPGSWALVVSDGTNYTALINSSTFSRSFTSGPLAITFGSASTVNHGLGAAPNLIEIQLVNISTDGGWTPGQTLILFSTGALGTTANQVGIAVSFNGTSITITAAGNGIPIISTTGAYTQITAANWNFIVKAWR